MKARVAVFAVVLVCLGGSARAQDNDGVRALLARVERAVQTGDAAAYFDLLTPTASRERAQDFASFEFVPGAARTSFQERDREALAGRAAGSGYRLLIDVFVDLGTHARIATWRLDVVRTGEAGSDREWSIADEERLSSVENIYRLTLDGSKSYAAHDLKISAEDLDLSLPDGTVFVATVDQGVTALVLLGRGTVNFHPAPATERGQVKIFCGSDVLDTRFDAIYIRINPIDFENTVNAAQLTAKPVDPRELKRAQDVFREESQKSFVIDLADLSRDTWFLLPAPGDFLAEMRTRRFDTLTYAKSSAEAEDITLFDRKRRHNIALYASQDKLLTRGRFYNEDDLVDYDILDYDIDVASTPDRMWIDGRVRMRLKVRSASLGALTLRLADPLVVQSIVSNEYGRLFGIRVKNQNTLVVNLPTAAQRGTEITLSIAYAGRLEPQTPERETLALDQIVQDEGVISAEPSFLYSSRSYWYPQAPVTDYATARIRITVPSSVECVASGALEPGFPGLLTGSDPTQNRKVYVFIAARPLRYLAFLVSRFVRTGATTVTFPESADAASGDYASLNVAVETNPRQTQRGRELEERAADIAAFYQSIIGDSPYSSFTVALIEGDLPGGHSPGYFAELYQPLPYSPVVWRNDPASFSGFPEFFLAHEVAHQWWGQAVGWRNYHEQWISEGFAQYFAAMYAQHRRGDDAFAGVLRQLRRWGMSASDQGPIYLGYRLGHLHNDGRVFRALVYNKGAAVLHMLRRLAGDEPFFRGLRRFYRDSRFQKAGTEGLRAAMEAETGLPLERFFEKWIYGSTLPKVKLTYRVEGADVVIRLEQLGEVFDVPVTVSVQYADRKSSDVLIPLTDAVLERRVPLTGTLRGVEISKDDGTLAEFVRN
jgi:Peptidase family M1 domain